jgi:hypothetical protein
MSFVLRLPEDYEDLVELYESQQAELLKLRAQEHSKSEEVLELKYKLNKVVKDLHSAREYARKDQLSAATHKQESAAKQLRIAEHCHQALVNLSGLERHSQHGKHFVESRTSGNLLLELRKLIVSILELESSHLEDQGLPASLETEPFYESSTLYDENRRLRSALVESQIQIEALEQQTRLIPQYRSEILRARSQAVKYRVRQPT